MCADLIWRVSPPPRSPGVGLKVTVCVHVGGRSPHRLAWDAQKTTPSTASMATELQKRTKIVTFRSPFPLRTRCAARYCRPSNHLFAKVRLLMGTLMLCVYSSLYPIFDEKRLYGENYRIARN